MAVGKFTKQHGAPGGTYTCAVCGKLTRETGEGESDCNLCAFCYQEGGMENALSDGHYASMGGETGFLKELRELEEQYNQKSTCHDTGFVVKEKVVNEGKRRKITPVGSTKSTYPENLIADINAAHGTPRMDPVNRMKRAARSMTHMIQADGEIAGMFPSYEAADYYINRVLVTATTFHIPPKSIQIIEIKTGAVLDHTGA